MYTITFYSFKGGVGRTLSMMNVCANLALRGKKVLLVDFDLEAPGLEAFPALSHDKDTPGLVEFVTDYMKRGAAPAVHEYIAPCRMEGSLHDVWLMKSGLKNRDYSARLSAIDWQKLYAEYDGYLLFEDLKAQWQRELVPDYVLIDSRTGHTDVGGICTRQLPDAVVACFIPNEENTDGLETVAADIRREALDPHGKAIDLHFVVSNVPHLDDEHGILRRRLADARARLQFDRPAAVIHRYESLSLLDNEIFSLNRRRTRLAREYRQLTATIIGSNLEDRDVALRQLRRTSESRHVRAAEAGSLVKSMAKIQTLHARDGEVLYSLSRISRLLGRDTEAQALRERAESLGFRSPDFALDLAQRHYDAGEIIAASSNLHAALIHPAANYFDLSRALQLCLKMDVGELSLLQESTAFQGLPYHEQAALCEEMLVSRDVLPAAEKLMGWIAERAPSIAPHLKVTKMLCLIGQGKFLESMRLFGAHRPDASGLDVADAFNYGMAEWGATRVPPRDLFLRVLELAPDASRRLPSKNPLQCFSIAAWAVGEVSQARKFWESLEPLAAEDSSETFSGWRYLQVSARQFQDDLREVRAMIDGASIVPAVLSEMWTRS